jgi:large subunit ribosomal protein L4
MPRVHVLDSSGKKVEEISAPEEILAAAVKEHLLYETVVNYRANLRRGTASTKTRGRVSGGGRKPWKQKGTGRARVGSIRSPLWKKGGTTFGPTPRDYSYQLPKKAKRSALRSALSLRLAENQLLVLKQLDFKEPKTKEGVQLMKTLNLKSALFVDSKENKNLYLSLRNIPNVTAVDPSQIKVYDVLNHKSLVLTQKAFEFLMEKLK